MRKAWTQASLHLEPPRQRLRTDLAPNSLCLQRESTAEVVFCRCRCCRMRRAWTQALSHWGHLRQWPHTSYRPSLPCSAVPTHRWHPADDACLPSCIVSEVKHAGGHLALRTSSQSSHSPALWPCNRRANMLYMNAAAVHERPYNHQAVSQVTVQMQVDRSRFIADAVVKGELDVALIGGEVPA